MTKGDGPNGSFRPIGQVSESLHSTSNSPTQPSVASKQGGHTRGPTPRGSRLVKRNGMGGSPKGFGGKITTSDAMSVITSGSKSVKSGKSKARASDFLKRSHNKTRSASPAVSKDVSYRKDVDSGGLRSRIPPSLIPQHMAMTEKTFMPPDDKDQECWYDDNEKVWVRVIFPRSVPSGRRDVELLERWLEEKLAGEPIRLR